MIKVSYNQARNTVMIEFIGTVSVAEAEQHYLDLQKIVPKCKKGFKLLTDFTALQSMDPKVQGVIKKAMDYFNRQGISKIFRVIPTPEQDFGLNILSFFHYSKEVKFFTLTSREEAEEHIRGEENASK